MLMEHIMMICGVLAVEFWLWSPGCGILAAESWLWNPGCVVMAVGSWLCSHGCGILSVESIWASSAIFRIATLDL